MKSKINFSYKQIRLSEYLKFYEHQTKQNKMKLSYPSSLMTSLYAKFTNDELTNFSKVNETGYNLMIDNSIFGIQNGSIADIRNITIGDPEDKNSLYLSEIEIDIIRIISFILSPP